MEPSSRHAHTGPGEGDSRMPAVKNVGEPCAGEPHARFEVAAGGNRASRAITCRAVQAPPVDPPIPAAPRIQARLLRAALAALLALLACASPAVAQVTVRPGGVAL